MQVSAHGGYHPEHAIKGGEDTSGHGQSGPLYVARAPYKVPLCNAFRRL